MIKIPLKLRKYLKLTHNIKYQNDQNNPKTSKMIKIFSKPIKMTRIPLKSSKWSKQPKNLKKIIIIPRKDQNILKITKITPKTLKQPKYPLK
jgi:hypothetical protein